MLLCFLEWTTTKKKNKKKSKINELKTTLPIEDLLYGYYGKVAMKLYRFVPGFDQDFVDCNMRGLA